MSWKQRWDSLLRDRREQGLFRRRRVLQGAQGAEVNVDGQKLINFCSNDYLGLANHAELIQAFKKGAERFGVGSGAAHLICGHMAPHHELEDALAEFTGRPAALLFSTGYMANLGVIQGLLQRGDIVFEDRLNHASLIDAAQLSRAALKRYRHADVAELQRLATPDKPALIATDGVFSMDGDLAPIPELAKAAQTLNALLMVDDAHGIGVLGPHGRGSLEHFGLDITEVPILMGTLGKALGCFGAFVAGSKELIEVLIQSARSYIYTTALPPAVAAATLAALKLLETESWRREKLLSLTGRFRQGAAQLGLQLMSSETPIQPILVGDAGEATALAERLQARGILAQAIRPPTVPKGSARIRITLSAAHSEAQVDELLSALEKTVNVNSDRSENEFTRQPG